MLPLLNLNWANTKFAISSISWTENCPTDLNLSAHENHKVSQIFSIFCDCEIQPFGCIARISVLSIQYHLKMVEKGEKSWGSYYFFLDQNQTLFFEYFCTR